MLDSLVALVSAGYADRLLVDGDMTMAGARAVSGGPGMPYLLRRLRPALVAEVGIACAEQIFVTNQARAFQDDW